MIYKILISLGILFASATIALMLMACGGGLGSGPDGRIEREQNQRAGGSAPTPAAPEQIDQVMVSQWDCARATKDYETVYFSRVVYTDIALGAWRHQWSVAAAPTGAVYRLFDAGEEKAWFCGEAGEYVLHLASQHRDHGTRSALVRFRVP